MSRNELAKKFPLELMCLSLLKERDRYGYEMLQEFKKRTGGKADFNITSLYMALKRLEDRGYISSYYSDGQSTRERARLYYQLTSSAPAYMEKLEAEYRNMIAAVEDFFRYSGEGNE